MLQVVEINAIEHLAALRLRWTALLYKTPEASFLHTLDWLNVYWQHFRDGQKLRVFLVHDGGTVLGIVPLVLRSEATAAGVVSALTYPTFHASHFLGPIGPNPTATLMATLRHLAGQPRDWDMLSLSCMGEHDRGRTANAMELAGFSARKGVQAALSKVSFDATGWEYLAELDQEIAKRSADPDHESQIKGSITFERVRPLNSLDGDDVPLERFVERCFALNSQSSPASPGLDVSGEFLLDVAAAASTLGMLDLNLLKWEGRVIAFSLNVYFDGVIQQLWAGKTSLLFDFDPARLLTGRMLRDSFGRKDRHIYLVGAPGAHLTFSAATSFFGGASAAGAMAPGATSK